MSVTGSPAGPIGAKCALLLLPASDRLSSRSLGCRKLKGVTQRARIAGLTVTGVPVSGANSGCTGTWCRYGVFWRSRIAGSWVSGLGVPAAISACSGLCAGAYGVFWRSSIAGSCVAVSRTLALKVGQLGSVSHAPGSWLLRSTRPASGGSRELRDGVFSRRYTEEVSLRHLRCVCVWCIGG